MSDEMKRQVILATKEVTVNIHGIEYDAILIPKEDFVEVDFSRYPEDDPLRRTLNVQKLTEVDLVLDHDLTDAGRPTYRLTEAAAKRLLESL